MAGCLFKDGVVADSNKLGGLSLIQCRDHLPKSHTIDDHLVPAGSVDMGTYRLKDLADPTDAQDIATKAYVDGIVGPTPASIPMIAWPTSFSKCNAADLQIYKDLGINTLMIYDHWWDNFSTSAAYVANLHTWFDNAAAKSMKLVCYIDNRTAEVSAVTGNPFITDFKGKSACGGWMYADEPHCWHDFGGHTIPVSEEWKYPNISPGSFTWPSGGHGQARMLYERIRGQDDDVANHPCYPVWDKGMAHLCAGAEGPWTDTYATIYTPGSEIFDIGSVDVYPNGNNWVMLDYNINLSKSYINGDGFYELGKGMIPVIDAWTDGAADALEEDGNCNLVNQCIHWEAVYPPPLVKGIGFYYPYQINDGVESGWLVTGAKWDNIREQIKDVCRRYGWGG